MHEAGVHLPAGEREIADTQRIGQKSGLRLAFGHIHLVVRGGVQNQSRIELGQGLFDALAVGDVDGLALESVYCKSARVQFSNQLHAELARTPKNYRPFGHQTERIPQPGLGVFFDFDLGHFLLWRFVE
jgi:hypothetical protein